MKKLT